MNLKLTSAQILVLNAVLSLAGTAVVSAVCAAYQYYSLGGIQTGTLINYTLVTFCVLFSKALHDYVPGHARDIQQSLEDAYHESQDALHTALQSINSQSAAAKSQATLAPLQAQPLVVIHTSAIPDVSASATSQVTASSANLYSYSDPMATPNMATGQVPAINILNNTSPLQGK